MTGVSLATGFWSLAACTALYGAAVAVTHSAAAGYETTFRTVALAVAMLSLVFLATSQRWPPERS